MTTIIILLSVLFSAGNDCDPPGKRDRSPCMHRNGHCFDLSIDGQAVTLLDDEAFRATLKGAASQPVCWHLENAVAGTLEAEIQANGLTGESLGSLFDEVEIVVTGLEGQTIPTKKGVRVDPTVLIGGVPMQTVVDVIDVEALPNGAYVATFRVRGSGGWDRKAVYLQVQR